MPSPSPPRVTPRVRKASERSSLGASRSSAGDNSTTSDTPLLSPLEYGAGGASDVREYILRYEPSDCPVDSAIGSLISSERVDVKEKWVHVAWSIDEQLGSWASDSFLRRQHEVLSASQSPFAQVVYDALSCHDLTRHPAAEGPGRNISDKLLDLCDALIQLEAFPALILVSEYEVAAQLVQALGDLPAQLLPGTIRPQLLSGAGSSPSISTLKDETVLNVLHGLQTGTTNVLVATLVGEDLTDLIRFKCVVRFNPCRDLVAYANTRARVGSPDGHLIHMLENEDSAHSEVETRLRSLPDAARDWALTLSLVHCGLCPPRSIQKQLEVVWFVDDGIEEVSDLYHELPQTGYRLYPHKSSRVLYRLLATFMLPSDQPVVSIHTFPPALPGGPSGYTVSIKLLLGNAVTSVASSPLLSSAIHKAMFEWCALILREGMLSSPLLSKPPAEATLPGQLSYGLPPRWLASHPLADPSYVTLVVLERADYIYDPPFLLLTRHALPPFPTLPLRMGSGSDLHEVQVHFRRYSADTLDHEVTSGAKKWWNNALKLCLPTFVPPREDSPSTFAVIPAESPWINDGQPLEVPLTRRWPFSSFAAGGNIGVALQRLRISPPRLQARTMLMVTKLVTEHLCVLELKGRYYPIGALTHSSVHAALSIMKGRGSTENLQVAGRVLLYLVLSTYLLANWPESVKPTLVVDLQALLSPENIASTMPAGLARYIFAEATSYLELQVSTQGVPLDVQVARKFVYSLAGAASSTGSDGLNSILRMLRMLGLIPNSPGAAMRCRDFAQSIPTLLLPLGSSPLQTRPYTLHFIRQNAGPDALNAQLFALAFTHAPLLGDEARQLREKLVWLGHQVLAYMIHGQLWDHFGIKDDTSELLAMHELMSRRPVVAACAVAHDFVPHFLHSETDDLGLSISAYKKDVQLAEDMVQKESRGTALYIWENVTGQKYVIDILSNLVKAVFGALWILDRFDISAPTRTKRFYNNTTGKFYEVYVLQTRSSFPASDDEEE
ncbi:hypothetical protein BOTBODRAFT_187467 [Botryobasidium botryosum FD-172 SS1]|uniref:Uncharacterized protein n=1 Tax=Botryobasidium botryosum (strain FD-172 SS1) TaxID=930990 RepID=A0A067MHL1_BOTB1|nr:hypothetical protein BOTBODRAFT_187467 [Botryobasidium botryosum FD-172 SS1]